MLQAYLPGIFGNACQGYNAADSLRVRSPEERRLPASVSIFIAAVLKIPPGPLFVGPSPRLLCRGDNAIKSFRPANAQSDQVRYPSI